jgi:phosphohistidine phosphatase
MFLYLIQHAEAKGKEEDPSRDLTEKGLQTIKRVAHYLGKGKVAVSQVLHSGKTRARSTGEILAESLKPPQGISHTDGLAPLDDPEIWAGRLSAITQDIALVGHLPHLARLAALLISGDQEKSVINFKMGGVVCLHRSDTGPWAVEWMIIPEILL